MSRQLVFVHGRAQENKDSVALKAEWIAAFREGLALNHLTLPLDEEDIRFPYYGQTLYDLVKDIPAAEVAEVIVRGDGADDEQQAFVRSVLEEVRAVAGITDDHLREVAGVEVVERGPLNWGWVRGILRGVDRFVPGASGSGIAIATNDVYQYLKNPGVRDPIEIGVREAFTPGRETVVVAHSLGTVVAYNLLRREGQGQGWNVPLFVTLGSPLGVTAIRNALRPIGHPACANGWFNAMDSRDVVALYPLDSRRFGIAPPIENKTDVQNGTENRHGISGYLNDKETARRIYDALTVGG
ncbi:MAG: alpha/beta hydrolase [Bryobacterales bacterium]|nr:alpha/beta hydrolase [Bryobacterales bacterium]